MEKVLKQFDIIGKIISYEIYGEGHINDTYLVFVENENRIIKYISEETIYMFKSYIKICFTEYVNNIEIL